MPSITNYTGTLAPYRPFYQRRAHPFFVVAFALIWLVAIGHEEYCRTIDRLKFSQAQAWPTVMGQTTTYLAEPVSVKDGKYSSHREYRVSVRYTYQVDGKTYSGSQSSFLRHENRLENVFTDWNDWSVTYKPVTENLLASEYGHNAKHTVRYDKSNPEKSYLEVEVAPEGPQDHMRHAILVGSVLLTIFAVSILSSGITKMR